MNAAQAEIVRGERAQTETAHLYAELRSEMAAANAKLADMQRERDILIQRLAVLEQIVDRTVIASSDAMVRALKQLLAEDGTTLATAIKESVIRPAVKHAA
jgi:hypothetical protein